jgi:hypothetical protein
VVGQELFFPCELLGAKNNIEREIKCLISANVMESRMITKV